MSAFHLQRPIRKRRWVKGLLISLVIVFLLLGASVGAGYYWFQQQISPLSSSGEEKVIIIEEGASVIEIAALLEQEGIIRSASAFDWYTRLYRVRGTLQAGGYKFSPTESVETIINRLREGDVATDIVTILPAQRLDQIKGSLVAQGFSASDVAKAFDPKLYSDHPALAQLPSGATLEGYLYPETFQRTLQTTVEDVVRASLDQMAAVLTTELQTALREQGLASVHEAIILASIVEREVSSSEDRAKVAQVFLKRYREGMMLGSDPTALYGALLAGIEPSVFADTPYNTRIYTGLPPGPINNVSRASLEALANPAKTEYLYFVSGDDGTTHFSFTLEEHEAATAKYCIELCRSY